MTALPDWSEHRCPKCRARLLVDDADVVVCSLVGCDFGVYEEITQASLSEPQLGDCGQPTAETSQKTACEASDG